MIESIKSECSTAILSQTKSLEYGEYQDAELNLYPESSTAVVASNISFKIGQDHNLNPVEVAENIATGVDANKMNYVSDVTSTGPYVNFHPSVSWLEETVDYLGSVSGSNIIDITEKDVSVEHTSVNPTGPIHIGRFRNSVLGDVISNLLEYVGHDVTRQYYVNDAGLQVAMITWGFNKYDESDLPEPDCNSNDCDLVRYYRKASENLSENGLKHVQKNGKSNEYQSESEVISILQGMESGDADVQEMVTEVVEPMLKAQVSCLEEFGIEFDEFTFESEYLNTQDIFDLIDNLKNLEESVKSEGAWCVKSDDNNLFVFQRSNGTTLYGTRDIMYHIDKFSRFDETMLVLGEDQEYQSQNVQNCLNLLGHSTENHTVVHHAFVETPEGGMSTRQGEGDFLYEVFGKTYENAKKAIDNGSISDKESVAKKTTIGSLRYNILSKKRQQLTTFDAEAAVDVNARTGSSVQYAYARLNGIIQNVEQDVSLDSFTVNEVDEINLIYKLSEYPLVLQDAIDDNEPQEIAVYLQQLQQAINKFYNSCPVNSADSKEIMSTRLKIVESTIRVFGDCLDILGIPKIEEM